MTTTTIASVQPLLEELVSATAHAVEDCIQEAMPSRASQMRCFYDRVTERALHQHLREAIAAVLENVEQPESTNQ